MIVIIDYHVGNLGSVTNACKRQGMDVVVTNDPEVIRQADGIILPGVGAFPAAMSNLEACHLVPVLNEVKDKGTPILGICIGMQLLFEEGSENGHTKGLGFLKGSVDKMEVDAKLPHMGWNQLHKTQDHLLLKYVHENEDVYFVHSYMAHVSDENLVAYSDYGSTKVTALVQNGNVMGCQFHPEKSGKVGQNILRAFKEMIEC